MKTLHLYIFIITLLLGACTPDDDSNNLYPNVVAGFTYNVNNLTQEVNFVNTSTGGAYYHWDFGDGNTSTSENNMHTYSQDGTYAVTLTVENVNGTVQTITQTVIVDQSSAFLINFESATQNYTFTDFGGAAGVLEPNPDPSGINTSANVGKIIKTNGAQVWAGNFITLSNPISTQLGTTFKVKVWSPKNGALVKLKLENLTNGNIAHEVDAFTTTSNQWEELTYDFSAANNTQEFSKVVIFFDFGNPGDNSTYYFDEVLQF